MGLSHLSIVNAHPDVRVVGLCDTTGYLRDVLERYSGLPTFGDLRGMLDSTNPEAVIIATPSRSHFGITREVLDRGMHAFVEKPLTLSHEESRSLVAQAEDAGVVNQVGYHYRFVGAFREVKRLLDAGAIGDVHNFRIEAYGPVILRPKGRTWRTQRSEGGGCLYDYASHAVNIVTWLFGMPSGVGGSMVNSVFSRGVEDEVYSTIYYDEGLAGQLCVNWSDETHRKMSMRVQIWGKEGRINADRQECQVYLRDTASRDLDLEPGWNVRYTTELTAPVRFYVRGEEYSAQLEHFIGQLQSGRRTNVNSFAAAHETDTVLEMIRRDGELAPRTATLGDAALEEKREGILGWLARAGLGSRRSSGSAKEG